ncbi:MAG: GntR family transcriptional regulator, partial [Chitinivibrionales bacterium]|nr:GntR family transcriptional regulator [Chitinivibrionales bacterium]
YSTMQKAIKLLCDKGLVITLPGRGILRREHIHTAIEGKLGATASERLFNKLKQRIIDGTYKAGEALPKLDHFVLEENVSIHTVLRAIRRLEESGIAHKQGKHWIAGQRMKPAPQHVKVAGGTKAPVVLLLVPDSHGWFRITGESRGHFLSSFSSELSKFGMLPQLVQQTRSDKNAFGGIPSGLESIRAYIRSLKNRYAGILIFSIDMKQDLLTRWIYALGTFGKPVVFYDFSNSFPLLNRKTVRLQKSFFRFYSDEQQAVASALAYLHRQGHRKVGYAYSEHYTQPWMAHRLQLIKKYAKELNPRIGIITTDKARMQSVVSSTRHSQQFAAIQQRAIQNFTHGVYKKDFFTVLKESIAAAHILSTTKGVTALIAPNDMIASEQFIWMRTHSVAIPSECSLISFDNAPFIAAFPVSTVDFGFSRLGYLAAHVFIDDIPVSGGTAGALAGRCAVIDRGSIGFCRNKKNARSEDRAS